MGGLGELYWLTLARSRKRELYIAELQRQLTEAAKDNPKADGSLLPKLQQPKKRGRSPNKCEPGWVIAQKVWHHSRQFDEFCLIISSCCQNRVAKFSGTEAGMVRRHILS